MARNSAAVESSTAMRTGGRQWQRCRHGQTMDSCGPPRRGGEAGGARTAAVNGEAARGRRWLGEWLFLVSLASDSGSWLLVHVEGVMAVRFPDLVGNDAGQRCPVTWSKVGGKSEAKRRVRGKRERARGGSKMGKELLWQRPRAGIRTNPRGAAATDGHRRQAALQAVSAVTQGGGTQDRVPARAVNSSLGRR
jgi:hypothetical protein